MGICLARLRFEANAAYAHATPPVPCSIEMQQVTVGALVP